MKKIKIKDVWAYLTGMYRYRLFYHPILSKLIRSHIREQIECRIESMDQECFNNGECKMCGCKTTALQMARKPCDKPCYPTLLGAMNWARFKGMSRYTSTQWWNIDAIDWRLKDNKFIKRDVTI